jgi:hypothetical protein
LWPVTAAADIPDGNIIRIMIYPAWLTIFTVQAGLLLACCWGKEYPMKIFLLLAGAFILFFIIYYWVLMPSDGLFVRIPFSEFTVNIHSDTASLSARLPSSKRSNAAWQVAHKGITNRSELLIPRPLPSRLEFE